MRFGNQLSRLHAGSIEVSFAIPCLNVKRARLPQIHGLLEDPHVGGDIRHDRARWNKGLRPHGSAAGRVPLRPLSQPQVERLCTLVDLVAIDLQGPRAISSPEIDAF
jgi:hypothetical protein